MIVIMTEIVIVTMFEIEIMIGTVFVTVIGTAMMMIAIHSVVIIVLQDGRKGRKLAGATAMFRPDRLKNMAVTPMLATIIMAKDTNNLGSSVNQHVNRVFLTEHPVLLV